MPFFLADDVLNVVYLGGSITDGYSASDRSTLSWRALTGSWLNSTYPTKIITNTNSGSGGTPSWYGLVRLATDVTAHNPGMVFIDFAVNDGGNYFSINGDRSDGWLPAAEALVRKIRGAFPNAKIVVMIFTWPENYSYFQSPIARNNWLNLASVYGLTLLRWDTYLESLMGEGYGDADVENYIDGAGDVHPNDTGHDAAFDLTAANLGGLSSSAISPLPTRVYSESEDFENDPIIRVGTDNDGETGTGWSDSGTARQSSTVDDTISWTGTFCSFGIDSLNGAGAGTIAWSLDGGAFTEIDLLNSRSANQPFAIWNMERGVHTVTFKVVSGTIKINRFLAI